MAFWLVAHPVAERVMRSPKMMRAMMFIVVIILSDFAVLFWMMIVFFEMFVKVFDQMREVLFDC